MADKTIYAILTFTVALALSFSLAFAGAPKTSTPMICGIINAGIEFRFAQEEAADMCGIDEGTGDELCLKKPSQSFIVMDEELRLRSSHTYREPLTLSGAVKLTMLEKDEFKGLYNAIATQNLILESTKFQSTLNTLLGAATYETDNTKMGNPEVGGKQRHDVVLAYLKREKSRYSRTRGPTAPKVLELEEQIKARKKVWADTAVKSDADLKVEVTLGHQKMFDFLAAKAKPNTEIDHQVFLAKRAFETGNWYAPDRPIDCSGKISPHKDMYFMRNTDLVNSATGKVFPKSRQSYHWHPKTFNPIGVMVFGGGAYALLAENGMDGSHIIGLGGRPRVTLLRRVDLNWQVIATSSESLVFY